MTSILLRAPRTWHRKSSIKALEPLLSLAAWAKPGMRNMPERRCGLVLGVSHHYLIPVDSRLNPPSSLPVAVDWRYQTFGTTRQLAMDLGSKSRSSLRWPAGKSYSWGIEILNSRFRYQAEQARTTVC